MLTKRAVVQQQQAIKPRDPSVMLVALFGRPRAPCCCCCLLLPLASNAAAHSPFMAPGTYLFSYFSLLVPQASTCA